MTLVHEEPVQTVGVLSTWVGLVVVTVTRLKITNLNSRRLRCHGHIKTASSIEILLNEQPKIRKCVTVSITVETKRIEESHINEA